MAIEAKDANVQDSYSSSTHVIEVQKISKSFYIYMVLGEEVLTEKKLWFTRKKPSELVALSEIDLNVDHGEFVALLGPSGCGKSTLLRILAGFETPSSGSARFKGELINGADPQRSMVFQSERAVFPWLSVEDNIGMGPKLQGVDGPRRKKVVADTISLVELSGFEKTYPKTLSGGMIQRVAVARAIVNNPELLLMDEPFGALDAQTRNTLQDHLVRIWKSISQTIIFVTHDIEEAVYLANRVVIFTPRPGKIKEVVDIKMKHPRDRMSPEFNEIRTYCSKLIKEN